MSGEDERMRRPVEGASPRPAAGAAPAMEEAPAAAPAAAPRGRRGKPPPGIISAGGVDMARAHASNIRPMTSEAEQKPVDEAKVVLVAEKTDPRRMRTMRRIDIKPGDLVRPPGMGDNGESPWAKGGGEVLDKAALPSANVPREAVAEKKQEKAAGSFWVRVATVAVVLLLIAGVSKRIYQSTKHADGPPATANTGGPLIPEPLPDDTAAAADTAEPGATTQPGVAAGRPGPAAIDPELEFTTEPTARSIRVKAPPVPPPPKPTFTPLFQLPEEKKN